MKRKKRCDWEERKLIAYLDGEADEETRQHVRACPHCARQVKEYARLQKGLSFALFRRDCPPSQKLGEFHLGLLSMEEERSIAIHLERCPHCRQELTELDAFLFEETAPVKEEKGPLATLHRYVMRCKLLERGRVVVQFLQEVPALAALPLYPSPRPLKEPELLLREGMPLSGRYITSQESIFSFILGAEEGGGIEAEFTARAQEDPALCTLYVHVTRPEKAGVEVILVHRGKPVLAFTDEHGQAHFKDVPLADLHEISIQINPPPEHGIMEDTDSTEIGY
ncbi:MAG: hypothetical protein ACUVV0_08610 [Anaerolineae bacterium]